MSHLIRLQEKIATAYYSLDNIQNKYTYRLNKFGANDELTIKFLAQLQDSKVELLNRERAYELCKAKEEGYSLLEAPEEAVIVNDAINTINTMIDNGKLEDSLISVFSYLGGLFFSNSLVKGILESHYKTTYNDRPNKAKAKQTKKGNIMKTINNGKNDSFNISNEEMMREITVNTDNIILRKKVINQFNQTVNFYIPNSEYNQVIAEINGKFYNTGFYDTEDMKEESDYLPVTYNGNVYCHYSYYYASLEHYYPKK